MTDPCEQPSECRDADGELWTVARRLPAAMAVTVLATAGVLAALLVLVNRTDWWRGLLAAGMVSAIAAGISILPVVWGLRRDLHKTAAGFIAAIGVRMTISLGGCLLAVLVGGYPAVPTLMLMMAFYLAVLAVETWLLASTLWPAKMTTRT